MKSKINILFRSVWGNVLKIKFLFFYLLGINPWKRANKVSDTIVSLTSYGDRVFNSVPYTVFSIMRQNLLPKEIILWIDNVNWNDENLPPRVKYLKKFGLTVRYCEDVRSYKKLIFSLQNYPKDNIVTIDDDVYYSKSFFNEIVDLHKKNPQKICTLHFCIVRLDANGNLAPYYEWEECHVVPSSRIIDEKLIFPQGYGGVLYPPGSFDEDVFSLDVARKLCPSADDVWFYCMSTKHKMGRCFAYNSKTQYYLVDMFRQLAKRDRLNEENVKVGDMNEVQMKKVMEYYKISVL